MGQQTNTDGLKQSITLEIDAVFRCCGPVPRRATCGLCAASTAVRSAERCLQTHLERELAADFQDRLMGWQRCLQKSACHTDKANENS